MRGLRMRWNFAFDEDGFLEVVDDGSMSENVKDGLETVAFPFGNDVQMVESYLKEWRKLEEEFGFDYSLNTSSAHITRIDRQVVKVVDMYDQFEDFQYRAEDFVQFLEEFASYLKSLEVGS
ncbi:hypothetical protein ACI2K4_32445 [Micromonospora sp. NPDC050397]|uniref:hypothetical protein n=1 Tax=Micromonospora sp. NPDC050397 TaxID=3364279 RepID=UPI00384F3403